MKHTAKRSTSAEAEKRRAAASWQRSKASAQHATTEEARARHDAKAKASEVAVHQHAEAAAPDRHAVRDLQKPAGGKPGRSHAPAHGHAAAHPPAPATKI